MAPRLIILLSLVLLTGCANGVGGQFVGFCAIAKPILTSRSDSLTRQTHADILIHNETGTRLCKWKPPGK